ncbi:hypothetical protein GCM10009634_64330 [Saccharothrix xinjiangensis]
MLFLLPVLLVLGASAGVVPRGAGGHAGPLPVSGWSASSEPSMHDDRHDWLRLSVAVRHVQAAPHPDTWWVTCGRVTGRCALRGRSPLDASGGAPPATAVPTPRSSRAPPLG